MTAPRFTRRAFGAVFAGLVAAWRAKPVLALPAPSGFDGMADVLAPHPSAPKNESHWGIAYRADYRFAGAPVYVGENGVATLSPGSKRLLIGKLSSFDRTMCVVVRGYSELLFPFDGKKPLLEPSAD